MAEFKILHENISAFTRVLNRRHQLVFYKTSRTNYEILISTPFRVHIKIMCGSGNIICSAEALGHGPYATSFDTLILSGAMRKGRPSFKKWAMTISSRILKVDASLKHQEIIRTVMDT